MGLGLCRYTYSFACEEGKRILPLEMAVLLWNILFTGAQAWTFLEDWIEFVEEHHQRPVMQDTWSLLLDFRRVRFFWDHTGTKHPTNR